MEASKARARARLLAARRDRPPADRAAVADAVAHHLLALPAVAGAGRVACYLSMGGEVGTGPFLAALADRGVEVLVPVVPDDDGPLDWVLLDPAAATTRSALGVEEPAGPRLGPGAIASADVVVVPALAVDHGGHRLGRGGGWYDRSLAGCDRPVVALVHADEVLPEVPREPHDVPVGTVVTEAGVFRVP